MKSRGNIAKIKKGSSFYMPNTSKGGASVKRPAKGGVPTRAKIFLSLNPCNGPLYNGLCANGSFYDEPYRTRTQSTKGP